MAVIIICVSCAFVWQSTPKSQQQPVTPYMQTDPLGSFFDNPYAQTRMRSAVNELRQQPIAILPYMLGEVALRDPSHTFQTAADEAVTYLRTGERYLFSFLPVTQYEYVAHIQVSGMDMIVYRDASTYSDIGYPVYYELAMLDTAVGMTGNFSIARLTDPQAYKDARIDADGTVTCTDYELTWREDPLKVGYKNNKVAARTAVDTLVARITAGGELVIVKGQMIMVLGKFK